MVTWFIFIMQFMWVWIDEFIGKGLDASTIFQFLGLLSLTLVPVALPLGILFAAIMTFGNLGESSELVAVKSSGISVARFAWPLFLFICVLTIGSFFFNNNIIPKAQLKAKRLLYDISNKKPVVTIKPGRFYREIPNHTLYISSKESDGQTVHDIKIYDHTTGRGNDRIIMAKKGRMYVTDDKRYLVFELNDGWRYEQRLNRETNEQEQIRLGFSYWKKIFDLSDFNMGKTDESYFKNLKDVMTAGQIKTICDSSARQIQDQLMANKMLMAGGLSLVRRDTGNVNVPLPLINTLKTNWYAAIPDSLKQRVLLSAEVSVRNIKSMIEINKQNTALQRLSRNDHVIELHKRFTIPLACLLLFVIGAALGSIIRKGGMGMPFISAVSFFVLFYFMNTMGEKITREQVVPVAVGMWYPSVVLALIGAFLMYKANTDSPLLNKEAYHRFGRKLLRVFKKTSNP
jgi:lipopolysaccharide export system permease protein